MVEVAVVMKIIKNCFREWVGSNKNHLGIGVVSLYASQVAAIQDTLGQKYDKHGGFKVKVKTIDGFQGGEEDIVIFSTAGTECSASFGSNNDKRTMVALTRARYCLWILGNESALVNEKSIWNDLLADAKKRKCFFNAGEDPNLTKAILNAKNELDQLDDLLNANSDIFKSSIWKDILNFTQVLRIWDILPSEDIPKVVKRLDRIFGSYTDDFINRCSEKCLDNETKEIPKSWEKSVEIIKIQKLDDNGNEAESSCYVEDSKVDESFLLLKFYLLSPVMVNHLLSDSKSNELEHLFEVSDEEHDNIHSLRSTFVLGRSGTGKTTVLTMKLFNMDESLNMYKEKEDSSTVDDGLVVRQLFVTVSPKLCQAVKHQVARMKRFSDLSFESLGVRSVALETFIRKKEVTYDRFNAVYWQKFNSKHTKMFDSSKVFTEIVSIIKGGQKSIDLVEGKLSRPDYLSLSKNRASSLSTDERNIIYDIYQSYEKMKMDKGDFDIADIVADLHQRLRNEKYEGDYIHFVYIDEVQDLTMSQIALFTYVCRNVESGFVFCGDTAQTIARGIDFRFEDIKSLFYSKFIPESEASAYNQGKDKAKTCILNQNFRTHSGVLKLSQSTIDLLSSFFPHSIDVLKPENSFIYGEAPVVLNCGSRKDAIVTIFGNTGHDGGKFVGFGAEQVILVRDDNARKEILNCIGKQALVLTILECKGLEFQDVLLYNFFGTSPLKNRWRVVYAYMDKQELDDTFAQTMKVASSPEEWKSRGEKLYYESNYEMAMMCFERARDFYWEKKSEAAGMTESAAQCFSDLGDYEQAGKLYIVKGKEPDLKRAGDCFYLAGSYEKAFKAYTRGKFFSECLKVCAKRGTYEVGLSTLQEWKVNEGGDRDWVNIEQTFRENCARSYFNKKDIKSMMKCIDDFHSIDFKRDFLRSLSLYDELLELEKKSCNYAEAIIIAKMMGDILCEVDLLEKMGNFYQAHELLIVYVLSNSLWSGGSNGWPLNPFTQKAELLERAMTSAKKFPSFRIELAQTEAGILSNKHVTNTELMDQLTCCRTNM
ncbi:lupus brain antigen-like protein, partial [Trifolium pratense]